MTQPVHPPASAQISERRKELAPGIHEAFQEFSRQVFADGALNEQTKQPIAVAVAHVTQCPYCIQGHTKAALRKGASEPELMEAIWVAAEMRAGGAYATVVKRLGRAIGQPELHPHTLRHTWSPSRSTKAPPCKTSGVPLATPIPARRGATTATAITSRDIRGTACWVPSTVDVAPY